MELPLKAVFYPLGFPLKIATNSRLVLQAAEDSWSGFRQLFSLPPMRIRIAVSEDGPEESPVTATHRAQGHLACVVSDRWNFAACDLANSVAFGWFTRATVEQGPWFRIYHLDKIVYLMLWQLYLTPLIQAGCVAREGRGVLLCGASGAGKSTLAFACIRQGWTYICDDAASLLRRSKERIVVGNPRQIRVRQEAAKLFPELKARAAAFSVNGKMTIELPTAGLNPITFHCPADYIIFLNRHATGPARLVPLHKNDALRRLLQGVVLFDKEVHQEHRVSLQNLLRAEAFELRYGNLDSAVGQLTLLMRQGSPQ